MNIFAAAKAAAAAADAKKPKKGVSLPLITDADAVQTASAFTRAAYLGTLLAAVVSKMKEKLGTIAAREMIADGMKTCQRPSNFRIITPIGQVSLNVSLRGQASPLSDETVKKYTDYGIRTGKKIVATEEYSFNSDVLKVPGVAQRISELLSGDEAITALITNAGFSGEIIKYSPESSQSIVTETTMVDLFTSATAGVLKEKYPDAAARAQVVADIYSEITVLKIDAANKADPANAVSLGEEMIALVLDAEGEGEEL